MISRSELKTTAKQALSGKWGFSIGLTLIILALPLVLNIIPLLGALAVIVISPSLAYIPQEFFLKIKRNEDVQIEEIFSALLNKLGTYWGIALRTFLKLLPWIALLILGNILTIFGTTSKFFAGDLTSSMVTSTASSTASIFVLLGSVLSIAGYILLITNSLYYVLAIYVKADNPNMTCAEAVLTSKDLMAGHRMEYFILSLSFIGWALVVGITFGIASFYVLPYMQTTFAAFYDELAGEKFSAGGNNDSVVQF